jgi:hypothetical protein
VPIAPDKEYPWTGAVLMYLLAILSTSDWANRADNRWLYLVSVALTLFMMWIVWKRPHTTPFQRVLAMVAPIVVLCTAGIMSGRWRVFR